MRNKKVLLIDSWTNGINHYNPFIDEFLRLGYQIEFIHINSINGLSLDASLRNDIRYVDVSYDNQEYISDLFKSSTVDLILFLSVNSLFLESLNLLARESGIKTVHIYHGLNSLVNWEYLMKEQQRIGVITLASKFWKNLKILKVVINIKPVGTTSATVLIRVCKSLLSRLINYAPHGTKEPVHNTDFGIVYCEEDVHHMHLSYGVDKSKIYIRGFPDLTGIDTNDKNVACTKDVVYISTALTDENLLFKSEKEYADYLIKISKELSSQSYRMLVKLKPHGKLSNSTEFLQKLMENSISYFHRDFETKYFNDCAFVLTEPSTYSIIPMYMKAKVGLVCLKPLSKDVYGEFLTAYPSSFFYESILDWDHLDRERMVNLTEDWHRDRFSLGVKSNIAQLAQNIIQEIHGRL